MFTQDFLEFTTLDEFPNIAAYYVMPTNPIV